MFKDDFVQKYKTVFHLAEAGTWSKIKEHGLLSTQKLVERHPFTDAERTKILTECRRSPIRKFGITIRDQKPMREKMLRRVLKDGITPSEWYRFLNRKVFFWTTEDRLSRFFATYKEERCLVLAIPSVRLLDRYENDISLCRINSGTVRSVTHYRDFKSFMPFKDFVESSRNRPVELTIPLAVYDIRELVSSVKEVGGGEPELSII
jgi:hypothetical protein